MHHISWSNDDKYQEIDLYDKTAACSALQGSNQKMSDAHGPKGVVMNIYGEVLCDDIFDRKCNGINRTTFRVKTAK